MSTIVMSLHAKLSALIICAIPLSAQPVITTAAGTDLVFGSNGKPAKLAALGRNSRVTVDPTGRVVFSDPNYNLVFRVNSDGSIQTIAGNNVQGLTATSTFRLSGGGYSGDNGDATMAALNRPEGVAYDSAGNLYIADTQNHRIRMVNTQGIITTLAGNGVPTYNGDGLEALDTSFQSPTDVAIDSNGNVYVNDTLNFRIRMISPQGIVSTVAGTGVKGDGADGILAKNSALNDVEAMTLDSNGNIYFTDWGLNRVRRVSAGLVSTVAGISNGSCPATADGPALSVPLCQPGGLAFKGSSLLVADSGNSLVRMLTGSTITTIGGTGSEGFSGDGQPALSASFHGPFGLAVDSTGDIYIADRENSRIRRIDSTGTVSTVAGSGTLIPSQNGVSPSLATFFDPVGVRFDSTGAMMIADTDNNIVRRANQDGTLATIAGTGAGERSGDNGPAIQAGLYSPFSITDDRMGGLLVTDPGFGTLRRFSIGGSISTVVSLTAGTDYPVDAVTDLSGNIFIADFTAGSIVRRGVDGSVRIYKSGLSNPAGLAIDSLGNV
jgi:sugar lactone lactonase YvrE